MLSVTFQLTHELQFDDFADFFGAKQWNESQTCTVMMSLHSNFLLICLCLSVVLFHYLVATATVDAHHHSVFTGLLVFIAHASFSVNMRFFN